MHGINLLSTYLSGIMAIYSTLAQFRRATQFRRVYYPRGRPPVSIRQQLKVFVEPKTTRIRRIAKSI